MEIDLLNTHVQLENDRVLLLPFEHPRNEEPKKIIFNDDIWTYIGAYVRTERDFANYSDSALKDKKNRICLPFIIIDKRNNKVAGSTRYGYLNPLRENVKQVRHGTDWIFKELAKTRPVSMNY